MSKTKKKEEVVTYIRPIGKRLPQKPAWYALKTKPRAEKKVNERLQEINITTYLPLTKELRQWSDRKKWVEEPLFRGYILVWTTPNEFIKSLEQDGAVSFVRFGGKPAVISEEQVDMISKILNNELRYEVTNETFAEGDKVEVISGPLKGTKGEWVKYKTKYNVAVHIHQLQRTITVEVPAAFIKKTDAPE